MMKPTTIDINEHHPIELVIQVRGVRRFRWRLKIAGGLIRLANRVAPANVNIVRVEKPDDEEPA